MWLKCISVTPSAAWGVYLIGLLCQSVLITDYSTYDYFKSHTLFFPGCLMAQLYLPVYKHNGQYRGVGRWGGGGCDTTATP